MFTQQSNSNTQIVNTKSSEEPRPTPKPGSEILTFYTTYTYYTTLFRGTETIISDSETVVTQYVTIESTPTDTVPQQSTSSPPTFSRSTPSDAFEIRIEPTSTKSSSTSSTSEPTEFSISSSDSKPESESEDDIQIIGVSTKVESSEDKPSVLTGTPTIDSNGATHILLTDFIVPSSEQPSSPSPTLTSRFVTPYLPSSISSRRFTSRSRITLFPRETTTPSSARDSASDLATTRLTDANVATHHIAIHPTTTYQSGSSQTLGIKPGAVIDLSDVLTNTNLVGNLGETIKDIVNLFAANGNKPRNNSSKLSETTNEPPPKPPSGGITVSSSEDPVYIPIGAIGRTTKSSISPTQVRPGGILQPSTILTGFIPMLTEEEKEKLEEESKKRDSVEKDISASTLTSVVFGSNTIFIQPSGTDTGIPATIHISEGDGRFHSSFNEPNLQGSVSNQENNQNQQATPGISNTESTSLITGLETIFFGFPDARQPPPLTTSHIQGSVSTSSIVGIETIFFDSPGNFFTPGANQINISGATTIFGTFPAGGESSSSSTPSPSTISSSSGDTTIFFPVPGGNNGQPSSPGTRYVTSVESVTLTLTLTTSSVYQTEGTPVTVTSVLTTTIPPRTFVSTIIGSRTILGTQPEPTEAVQVIPSLQPSESTTTVTTTTLIFNSIATTVVRTLVIPTNAFQPTKVSTNTATEDPKLALGGVAVPGQKPKPTVTTRKPIQLFKSGNRPTEPTTPKPARAGPPLKLFPTKPPTTTAKPTPARPNTTKKTFRKPGKTLIPIVDGCPRECNLKNKEVCKQNPDRSWSCQCRPGFFKTEGSDECKDVKSYVVVVRVLKMGGNDISYQPELNNYLSDEYKNLTTTARKAVDDAYKTSSVGDDYVSANVIGVQEGRGFGREGVLVNMTVQLRGEKAANEEFLKEELAQSLEAAASDLDFANATVVSPIIQRVEDVQDFDECYDDTFNDCSRSSICINLPGSYTCECKEGYQDLEPLLPGRICSGEVKDCDYCNNRGVCIMTEDDNKFCRCYRMYLGKQCEINGLVLAIALPIALALLILTMFCLLCGCRKLRQKRAQKPKPNNVFKGMVPPMAGTLDRKAMIMDSSSESSGEHRPPVHAYDGFSDDLANSTMKRSRRNDSMDDHMSADFQVPTVLIPRAKHSHPNKVNAPYPNYRMPPEMDRW
ncbi:uncharacterized protein CEXT_175881 [Caerostris extrusa]|uniref:Uncharacterized protein n=1 Tax=Caerostris extrusa TaxID=172846 RepID=A0AAV4NLM4_CAEEX|nr:uncharacterized protein CEXT_175881 [Caerostris extrusa]